MSSTKNSYAKISRASRALSLEHEANKLRAALEVGDWSLTYTATELACPVTTLRKAIARHPRLLAEYKRRNPGPGRLPRSTQ